MSTKKETHSHGFKIGAKVTIDGYQTATVLRFIGTGPISHRVRVETDEGDVRYFRPDRLRLVWETPSFREVA